MCDDPLRCDLAVGDHVEDTPVPDCGCTSEALPSEVVGLIVACIIALLFIVLFACAMAGVLPTGRGGAG